MRVLLSNGEYLYIGVTNARLLSIGSRAYLVDNNTLYGITDDGTRYRLNHTTSGSTLNSYNLQEYVYTPSAYGGSWSWSDTNLYISSSTIPPSLNADSTFNFEDFNPSLLLTFILATIVILLAFKRR